MASLALGVWCLLLWWSPHLTVSARGTTLNLKEIFLGRCWDYQRIVNPGPFTGGREKDCILLWQLFSDAFTYKDACNVSIDSYNAFAEAAVHDLPPDKSIFWHDTSPLVRDYSHQGKRAYEISDTLLGYMIINTQWCGMLQTPGMNMDICPPEDFCQLDPILSYWRSVSPVFAARAVGTVRVMLNGSSGQAFKKTSVFGQYELPNINPGRVTKLEALVVHDFGHPVRETCGEGTLAELESTVEGLGIKYDCTDDPADVHFLMCVDNIDVYECRMIWLDNIPVLVLLVVLLVLSVVEMYDALMH